MKAFIDNYGIDVIHAWGMTEMSPIGTLSVKSARTAELPEAAWWKLKLKQGRVALRGRHEDHRRRGPGTSP